MHPAATDLLQLTVDVVAAHASSNDLSQDELLALIRSVHAAFDRVGGEPVAAAASQEPAVPIKRSVFPDYIVCLEDGKKLKMLKRHLQTSYGMTVDEYRAKWGLPQSYPMVAPTYAEHRSTLAKKIGLGRTPKAPPAAPLVQRVPEGASGLRRRAPAAAS